MRTALFTIISPNYRHFARVLMDSARRHHPEWERFVVLVGDADGDETFTTIPLHALPLPDAQRFRFRYNVLEFNTAIKPWVFEHLFARGYDRVVYLDPDIAIYSPLAELDDDPDAFLTLTPHLTGFIPGDDHPSERSILLAGTYNLGFLAVTRQPQVQDFLRWWQGKLEFQCAVEPARGLFADQKWIDLTPGLFDGVRILRHDGYNAAYWNLAQRTLTTSDAGDATEVMVNGQPLRFFHFSGFDPAFPGNVSRHDTRQRLARDGAVRKLFDEYVAALRLAGYESFRAEPYPLGVFADGTRIPNVARVAYRNSPALQTAAGEDPFRHPELFRGMQDPPRDERPPIAARMGVASYRTLSRARPLVRLLPRAVRTAVRELLLGRRETPRRIVQPISLLPPGLNVVGYFGRGTGVGESARLAGQACARVRLAHEAIDVDDAAPEAVYRASVYHVNADQLPALHERLPELFAASAYNIGCWHWELPELPQSWTSGPLDEIWAPSAFIQSAVSRRVAIPVVHMPHGVEVTRIEACAPQELGVQAGRFTFLFLFDFDSVMERKNPQGAIEAFARAFAPDEPVTLLIKVVGAGGHAEEYRRLAERVAGVPNVVLSDVVLTRERVNGLIAACDGVLSLHRSEGFGLILAEAMSLGKPVVATGWSGNMDFMTASNSCPVDYELVTLGRDHGHYQAGQQWAEPDVGHAARLLRRLFDDADFRARIGERAQETMRGRFSPEEAGQRMRRRLAFLGLADERF
jgi:glycosyltransferase involved in cell wall biosynthesis